MLRPTARGTVTLLKSFCIDMVHSTEITKVLLSIIPLIFQSCFIHGLKLPNPNSGLSNYSIPANFMFGISTAAYQIEGGWKSGGRGESIWDTYLHKHPNFTRDHKNGDVAADAYNKYEEDLAIIDSLGISHYKMSISWSRILPQGTSNYVNEEGVQYYRNYFESLIKLDIVPVVTLYHWDLPTIFADMGGWTNPKIIDYFEDYARIAYKLFGDVVKIWITVNEPHQHCTGAYGSDFQVPALNYSGLAEYLCAHNMLLAHARAYHLYDKEFRSKQNGKVGITLDSLWPEPKNETSKEDAEAAERYLQMHLGLFAHPIFSKSGDYPKIARERIDNMSTIQGYSRSRLPTFSPQEINLLRGSSDFFGLNHYTTYIASPSSFENNWNIPSLDHDTGVKLELDPNLPLGTCGWLSIYPPGLRSALIWVKNNYGDGIPIIIAENGFCDIDVLNDYGRVSYYNEYINQMLIAIYEDKCNVQGYFAWTLLDNFEWSYGYTVKMGLTHVDFNSPERTRTLKLSALNFREIARTRRVDFDFTHKFQIYRG